MKITIEYDDGKGQTFENVTDAYLAVRTLRPTVHLNQMTLSPDVASYSWGGNVRELAKELTQSLVELQDLLRELRNGSSERSDRSVAGNSRERSGRLDKGN